MKLIKTLFCLHMITLCLLQCSSDESRKPTQSYGEEYSAVMPFKGRIIFQSNMDGDNEIYLLTATELTKLTDNTWQDEYPVWSPDGTQIAFSANPQGNYDIFIMPLDGSQPTAVTSSPEDEKEPSWYPDGTRVAFSREIKKFLREIISLHKVNIQTKRVSRVIPRYSKSHGISHVSPDAPLITFTGKRTFGWDVAIYNWKNQVVNFLEDGGKSCRARFSRDGKNLAYVCSKADGKGDIWMMTPEGENKTRLTIKDTYDYFPAWSPDGQHIVFNASTQHNHNGDWQLYILDLTTRNAQLLFDSPGNDIFPDWHK